MCQAEYFGERGRLAQLGEHLPYKQGVIGSSPIAPTNYLYVAIAEMDVSAWSGAKFVR